MTKYNLNDKITVFSVKDVSMLFFVNEETVRLWIKSKKLEAIGQGSNKEGYIILSPLLNKFLEKTSDKNKKTYKLARKSINVGKTVTIRMYILEYLYGFLFVEDFLFLNLYEEMDFIKNFKKLLKKYSDNAAISENEEYKTALNRLKTMQNLLNILGIIV